MGLALQLSLCSEHVPTSLPNDPLGQPRALSGALRSETQQPAPCPRPARVSRRVGGGLSLGQAVTFPEPWSRPGPQPHTPAGTQGSTAHHWMGSAGSERTEKTQAGGPGGFLGR